MALLMVMNVKVIMKEMNQNDKNTFLNKKTKKGKSLANKNVNRTLFLKICYLARMNNCTGVPVKSHHSRSLFSKKRRYGSFTYCGRLAKNTKVGIWVFGN